MKEESDTIISFRNILKRKWGGNGGRRKWEGNGGQPDPRDFPLLSSGNGGQPAVHPRGETNWTAINW